MVLSALKASRRSNLSKSGVKKHRVDDVNVDLHDNNISDDEIEEEIIQLSQEIENIGIKTLSDAETQTRHFGETNIITSTHMHINWRHAKILISILPFFSSFNAIHLRVLSMIVYVALRLANISYERVGEILKGLNLNGVSNCCFWTNEIIENDDVYVVMRDRRGSYKRETFYDFFPNLENEAREYAMIGCSKK